MPDDEINDIVDQARRLAHGHSIENAHPYVKLWVFMRNLKETCGGALPHSGGWLDQDYETMFALDLIERTYQEEKEIAEKMRRLSSRPMDTVRDAEIIDLSSYGE